MVLQTELHKLWNLQRELSSGKGAFEKALIRCEYSVIRAAERSPVYKKLSFSTLLAKRQTQHSEQR